MKHIIVKFFIYFIHLLALSGIIFCNFDGWSDIGLFLISYIIIGFGVTVAYHRYFAHHSFRTNRLFQFIMAFWGCMSLQGGPLFWTAAHRHHHKHSDEVDDIHSARHRGFWHAHMGWLCDKEVYKHIDYRYVKDLMKLPEIVLLDNVHLLPPALYIAILMTIGFVSDGFNAVGWGHAAQLVTWGFLVPVVFTWHITWSINSVTHFWGPKRFNTKDDSRNVWWLGLLALGEGWHNNHHRYQISVRHGFYWYEIDFSYYVILLFKCLGLAHRLQYAPQKLLKQQKIAKLERLLEKLKEETTGKKSRMQTTSQ